MDHFLYRNGRLHAEDVPVEAIAATVGTPVYVYSTATLLRHFRLLDEALAGLPHLVCFAVKALSNVAVLKLLGTRCRRIRTSVVEEGQARFEEILMEYDGAIAQIFSPERSVRGFTCAALRREKISGSIYSDR